MSRLRPWLVRLGGLFGKERQDRGHEAEGARRRQMHLSGTAEKK
jgi:hypothetical protein